MYTNDIFKKIGAEAENMVIPISWHIDINRQLPFVTKSTELWKADVNWRTANAYNATKALIAALKINPTRDGVQKQLYSGRVLDKGAYDDIQFSINGDNSNSKVILVQVQKVNNKYKFVPCGQRNNLTPCKKN